MTPIRLATLEDVPALEELIAESARRLCRGDYTGQQIEAALSTAWAVDTELIRDGTYFVIDLDEQVAACGGWSRRATLFGGDAQPGRRSDILDPARDAARIRAFFVRPGQERRGIGRALLEHCEAEARANGFQRAELMATLTGVRLYEACGYRGSEPVEHPLVAGLRITFVPMHKALR